MPPGREQAGVTAPEVTGFRIDDLIIDLGQRRVTRGTDDIPLPGLSFDLLVALARAAPNFLSFDQLIERVWPGLVVSPETISQRVKLVRDALSDDPHAPRYIGGVRGRGYRIVAAVRPVTTPQPIAATEPALAAPAALVPSERTEHLRSARPLVYLSAAGVLAVVLAVFIFGLIRSSKHSPAGPSETSAVPDARSDRDTTAAFAPPQHSIAVLPFVNMSGDKDQEYFSDGLSEELLNALSRVEGLQVSARTSSFSFKGERTDIAAIAHKLNVATVLEGSVRRSANTVRVDAELVDATTGYQLWSHSYDRNLGDILALQTEIAGAVTQSLQIAMSGAVAATTEMGATRNSAAFDAYLKGLKLARTAPASAENMLASIEAYSDAIRLDSNYALALAGRAYTLGS